MLGDEVLIDLPRVARVLVRAGECVGVEPAPDVDPGDLDWLLEGHVRQVADLQRGRFALHASAVVIDGGAVAICAHGATGGSSVAAGLANRGHAVIADGWLPVSGPELLAEAWTDELALWPDVAKLIDRDPEGGRAVRAGLKKRRHRFERGESAPLAALVMVHRYEWEDDASAERVGGGSAVEQVLSHVALNHLVSPMGLEAQLFMWGAGLASGCPVHRLDLDRSRPGVVEPAEAIEALVRR